MNLNEGPSMMRDEGPRQLMPFFINTLGEEDVRRPRMELGLGSWSERRAIYFPMDALRAAGGFLFGELDSRPVLVVLDPLSRVPVAFRTDAASAHWRGDRLQLDNGLTYAGGGFRDANGNPVNPDRPLQLFTRWYGFSFTFPGCEIHRP